MSTSLLYHAFGLRGYRYVATEYLEGGVMFRVEARRETCRCATCDSASVILRGAVPRVFRSLPIGGKPVWIHLPVQRVECRKCGVVRQIDLRFATPDAVTPRPLRDMPWNCPDA